MLSTTTMAMLCAFINIEIARFVNINAQPSMNSISDALICIAKG